MGIDLDRRLCEAEDELEYHETLRRKGEAEQRRMEINRSYDGDFMGYDDGRPGLHWNWSSGRHVGSWGGVPVELLPRIAIPPFAGLIDFGLWAWNSVTARAQQGAQAATLRRQQPARLSMPDPKPTHVLDGVVLKILD